MKIAILDDYQDCVRTLAAFQRLAGHEVVILNETITDPQQLAAHLPGVEALVLIRERTRISAALLDRLPALKLISQTGRHGPHIDLPACTARGVAVAIGRGSPHAPAELTWALVLAAMRGIAQENAMLKAGRWQTLLGRTVRGRTLGVLGYGNIGKLIAGYGRAFGMNLLTSGREATRARAQADGIDCAASQRELFERSDVLSVHVRLAPETRGIVGLDDLKAMPPASLFVNTSRAELVAPGALLAALNSGRPGMAAVDVFEAEPAIGDPLVQHPRVLATPHIGYVERDSYELYFGIAFDNLVGFARGEPVELANPEVRSR